MSHPFKNLFKAEQDGYVEVTQKKNGDLNVKITKKGRKYVEKLKEVV